MDELRVEIEVERHSPGSFRAFSVHLFDYFLFFLLGGLFFFLLQLGFNATPVVKEAWAAREKIQEDSSLYIRQENSLKNIGDYYEKSGLPYTVCIDAISERLDGYFNTFFTQEEWKASAQTYSLYRDNAKSPKGETLFGENGKRLLTNPDYDEIYFNWYRDCAKDYAPGYLSYKKGYTESRRTIVIFFFVALEGGLLLSYALTLLAPSLVLHRGRQTLGMKLSKVYLLDQYALSPSLSKYLLYRLTHFLVFGVAAPLTLFIPYFISITMLILRKEKQTLMEYIFAYFPVEAEKKDIFESEDEIVEIGE